MRFKNEAKKIAERWKEDAENSGFEAYIFDISSMSKYEVHWEKKSKNGRISGCFPPIEYKAFRFRFRNITEDELKPGAKVFLHLQRAIVPDVIRAKKEEGYWITEYGRVMSEHDIYMEED